VFADRRARFDRFLADVPVSLRQRVRLALGDPAWLLDEGPGFPAPGAGAIAAFAHMRSYWDIPGEDHPALDGCRGPLPAAFVELLLDHPGAEVIGAAHCPWCRALVTSVPAHGEPGVHIVWTDPLVSACPFCSSPIPPAERYGPPCGPECPDTRSIRPPADE
jgi:hypothetical protein